VKANNWNHLLIAGLLLLCTPFASISAKETAAHSSENKPQAVPLEQLRIFAEVFGRIKKDYVEPVDDKQLLEDAIRGMLAGLDPHSSYLSGDRYKDLREGTSGKFGGLGIQVGVEDGFIKIIAPIDDTPAQKAGLKSGDQRCDGRTGDQRLIA